MSLHVVSPRLSRWMVASMLVLLAGPTVVQRVALACDDAVEGSRPFEPTGRTGMVGEAPRAIDAKSISMTFVPAPNDDQSGCGSEPTVRRGRCASAAGLRIEFAVPVDADTPAEQLGYRIESVGAIHPEFMGPDPLQGSFYADDGVIELQFFQSEAHAHEVSLTLTPIDPDGNEGPTTAAFGLDG